VVISATSASLLAEPSIDHFSQPFQREQESESVESHGSDIDALAHYNALGETERCNVEKLRQVNH